MPDVGTCPACERRFALFRLATSGTHVLVHHNAEPRTRCLGAGGPPLDGSVSFQDTGRTIDRCRCSERPPV